ncbi:MAG: nuclear transport factor 2 family protein [Nitrospinae bacterium]|nr:nuclear transport factor 2 family protein [Nitrospinota bacterium]
MKPVETPITGGEDRIGLSGPHLALSEFYEAFNNRDFEKMSRNWADSEEIAMDNPLGGIRRGRAEIMEVYSRIFGGPARVYVEFYDYTIHEAGGLFYAVGRERGRFQKGGASVELAIRTSRVFRLVAGRWRQVHHHGSIDDPALLDNYQRAVTEK